MVRFAAECAAKMKLLLSDLVDRLGEDTTTLEMRVGLHSGSVTGGVLRGQKARFQLFVRNGLARCDKSHQLV